jgi:hypothetical protein
MVIYNETASMDGSQLLKKFKEQVSMENAMICNIQTNCKCSIGGESNVEVQSSQLDHHKKDKT